jgi:translocation and assembly module TamB
MVSDDTKTTQAVASSKRKRRWWLPLFALLVSVLIATTAWISSSERGARTLLSLATTMSGGIVQADGVSGQLNQSVRIQRLAINLENQNIVLDDIALELKLAQLLKGKLHVAALQIGKLGIVSKIDQSEEASVLPDSISLPLRVQIDSVQVAGGEIAWGPLNIITLGAFAFNLDFDGQRYLLNLDRFSARSRSAGNTFSGDLNGKATLSASKPYPLQATLSTDSETTIGARTIAAKGKLDLQGSLAELIANVDVRIDQASVSGKAVLRPFGEQLLGLTTITARHIDLALLAEGLPTTALDIDLHAQANGKGTLKVDNPAAGLYNDGRLPLHRLAVDFSQREGKFDFNRIVAETGGRKSPAGIIDGQGSLANGALLMHLSTKALDLRKIDMRARATKLVGSLDIRHANGRQDFTLALREPRKTNPLILNAHAMIADNAAVIDKLELRAANSAIDLSANFALAGRQAFNIKGAIRSFKLSDLGDFSQLPALHLNGEFSASGKRLPALEADASFRIANSQLAGNPLSGEGEIQLRADTLLLPKLSLVAGSNRLSASGKLAEKDARISFKLDAPAMEQLGKGFGGVLQVNGEIRGSVQQPRITANWNGQRIRVPDAAQITATQGKLDLSLNRKPDAALISSLNLDGDALGVYAGSQQLKKLQARVQYGAQSNAPLMIQIDGDGISGKQLDAQNFRINVAGTSGQHVLNASLLERDQDWKLTAAGGLQNMARDPGWRGNINALEAKGRLNLKLAAPASLQVSQRQVQLDQFRLAFGNGLIAIEQFLRNQNGVSTRGRLERLPVAELLRYVKPEAPFNTDLTLAGEWNLQLGDRVDGSFSVRRESGDVAILSNAPVKLGLSNLVISGAASKGRIALNLQADGSQVGRIAGSLNTVLGGADGRFSIAASAPFNGSASINTPTLAWLGPLVSQTLVTEGSLRGELALSGSFGRPQFSGTVAADQLRLLFSDTGVDLKQGTLRSEFRGDQLIINQLAFQNGGGTLLITGPLSMVREQLALELAVKATRYTLINRSDRKLVVSGDAAVGWREGSAKANGKFVVDSGLFDIGSSETPQLSDDVVIVGQSEKQGAKTAIALDLALGLGKGVRVQGRGLNAMLVGDIRLLASANDALRAQGTLSVASGTFKAYGRELAIEQGLLRFSGPLNNPALDILAMRRGQEVEAGVSVRGTVLAPRITLVSEPNVADADKLSWLVLGRGLAGAGEGDISALQSAASSLLTQGAAAGLQSQIATAFGLDDFSIGSSDSNLQERIVTLGKKISSRLYVSYKQSLESAGSVLLLRYTLTPRLTVEAEAGTSSALSLLYNFAFD